MREAQEVILTPYGGQGAPKQKPSEVGRQEEEEEEGSE